MTESHQSPKSVFAALIQENLESGRRLSEGNAEPITVAARAIECPACQRLFFPARFGQRFCSKECRAELVSRYRPRISERGVATSTTGAAVELLVAAKLMLAGWSVFRSLSPACYCDLLAVKGPEIRHLEVRLGSRTPAGKLAYPSKARAGATEFAVYLAGEDEVIFLPIKRPLAQPAPAPQPSDANALQPAPAASPA